MSVSDRKRRGAWYTPDALVARVVEAAIDAEVVGRARGGEVRVLDPACGDGRFLVAAAERVAALGGSTHLVGYDIDRDALAAAASTSPDAELVHADALGPGGPGGAVGPGGAAGFVASSAPFDVVIGNPPYLSQLSSATTRGTASAHGGGPYADAAVEFLALAAEVVRADGGRVGFVLPQSILASRDAHDVRERIDARASMIWSTWTGARDFDAQVVTCALVFEFGAPERSSSGRGRWARVVTERTGVPPVPSTMATSTSTLGDRGWLNANFRDEYYGLVGAVADRADGPPLVTSGLIDPGRSLWGRRPVRFAKQRFAAPRVDVDALDDKMQRWADRRLVPKVLVANQTRVLEAVADVDGVWLPGVPVVSIYPHGDRDAAAADTERIAAVLTSASASAWAWHERGGTGLSATTIRVGPVMLAALPWPAGPLDAAVDALRAGDVVACGQAVDEAYGAPGPERAALMSWWQPIVEGIIGRAAT